MENQNKKTTTPAPKLPDININIFGEDKQNALILGNIATDTEADKIKLYNLICNCEKNVNDILNIPKKIKAIYISKTRITKNDNPRGYEDVPRIVFIFDDESAVITFSIGVYIALKRLISVFGEPPYNFNCVFRQLEKNKVRIYTIDVVADDPKN